MKMRWIVILGLAGAGSLMAAGQDTSTPDPAAGTTRTPLAGATQNAPAQSASEESARKAPATALSGLAGIQTDVGVEDTFGDLPQIPALLGGKRMTLAFLTEMARSNYLRLGLNVGAAYEDNPLLLSSGAVGNTSGSVFPNVSIEQTTSRARWSAGYAGGLTVNQRLTSRNQGSHNLNFDSQFRMSPHVNLRVAETFSVTTGVFDTGNGAGTAGGTGGPNGSLLVPLATQRASLTTVEANYHFALKDLVGGSGAFYDLHFANPPTGVSLANTQTASGSAFWLHKIFRGNWGGLSYAFQRVTFDPNGESRVHNLMAVDTLKLANRFTLSAFAGPEYSDSRLAGGTQPPVQSNQWAAAGGVEGGWQDERTSLVAGYSRRISDGAGLLGAVRVQNVHASFRRELVSRWAATLAASHGTNTSLLTLAGTANSVNLTSMVVGLDRNVGKGLGLRLSYAHDFQQQFGVSGGLQSLDAHRNRFTAALSYQWAKPLGM